MKSLAKHYDELESYINSLNFKFSSIALTENWLGESKQDLYDLQGYSSLHKFRKEKRGDGVSLYIENGIGFTNKSDLEYLDSDMESLFIEAEGSSFNLSSIVIIAVIHRMPKTSLDTFNILKHENHGPISEFLDTMYRQFSNISRTQSPNINVSRLVLQLSLPNLLKPWCQVKNEDVVGAAPTGDAPATSEWSTILLPTKARLMLETLRYS